MSRKRYPIAGVPFDLVDHPDVLAAIVSRPMAAPLIVTLVNPHTVMNCRASRPIRDAVLASDLILPDGVGIALAARLLGLPRHGRIPGPSLVLNLCRDGRSSGLRHYFYGGAPGVARNMAARLSTAFPGLEVAGWYSPPLLDPTLQDDHCARINEARPDVIWVGLGSPKQELWMARNAAELKARAVIGVGAAFDFHSGNVSWAPEWVRRIGLEWAYRLAVEPRRMWRRNLDSPWFLGLVLKQRVAAGSAPLKTN